MIAICIWDILFFRLRLHELDLSDELLIDVTFGTSLVLVAEKLVWFIFEATVIYPSLAFARPALPPRLRPNAGCQPLYRSQVVVEQNREPEFDPPFGTARRNRWSLK